MFLHVFFFNVFLSTNDFYIPMTISSMLVNALGVDLSKAIGAIRHAVNKFAMRRIRECC